MKGVDGSRSRLANSLGTYGGSAGEARPVLTPPKKNTRYFRQIQWPDPVLQSNYPMSLHYYFFFKRSCLKIAWDFRDEFLPVLLVFLPTLVFCPGLVPLQLQAGVGGCSFMVNRQKANYQKILRPCHGQWHNKKLAKE